MSSLPLARGRSLDVPLEKYLQEINETPLLDAEEEKYLARLIEKGDPEAREHLVRANLRLVVNIARAYLGKGLGLEDLIEEGNLGLLRAAEGFDPCMNTRFSTYASFWIKESIRRSLARSGRSIRIPTYMVGLLSKWRRATSQLQNELGRPPRQDEIANHLGFSKKKLKVLEHAIRVYNSGPLPEGTDSGWGVDESFIDMQGGPDNRLMQSDALQFVLKKLSNMDAREAAVLRLRFGLDKEPPKTLKEVGQALGITRERARQIENEALGKLRAWLEADESVPNAAHA